ncbi:hypothetical protein ACE3NQ_18230 [Paenibacillus terreus]|uniref:Uncharacterized protein n=1 Tax=Paenibacillus terreus TaxID=1387834 RepID=A0ABV5BAW6_9BACL
MSRYKQFLLMVTVSILFSIMNLSAYSEGHTPSALQAAASVLFIAVWFVFGLMSHSRWRDFILVATIFWVGGAMLLAVGYVGNIDALFIPAAIVVPGPSYGIRYFWKAPSDITFAFAITMISYVSGILGLAVGQMTKLRSQ